MPVTAAKVLSVTLIVLSLLSAAKADERVLIGPAIGRQVYVGAPFIFAESDSLYLNGRRLVPGSDYVFRGGAGYFDLFGLMPGPADTLTIRYQPVPSWLKPSYGRPLPPLATEGRPTPESPPAAPGTAVPHRIGEISLTGAKSFRVFTSGGSSEFSQSLDLSVAGELTPGLELKGTVSDRGFDPTYGTSNSRLSELDKLNLSLTSSRLAAQIGDILVSADGATGLGETARNKSIAGASARVAFPNWYVSGTAARPKGRFESVALAGLDGFQGPYQIGSGASARPVVPGSETVWLDGEQLERGSGKDYVVEYPTGRITFTSRQPIDSRRRIEIDFEPLDTDYEGELFAAAGGAYRGDSALYVAFGVVREGDDTGQPLAGQLSEEDRSILARAGDSLALRSGVTPDTAGSYVAQVQPSGDTVYQYVGTGSGDYTVHFSYVGVGRGAYRYLGSERYEYAGENLGEYAPVVILPAAARSDFYQAQAGGRVETLGDFSVDLRAARHDKNLWSPLDDADNGAVFYRLGWDRSWQEYGNANHVRAARQLTGLGFTGRQRLNRADFRWNFMVPDNFQASNDELFHDFESRVSLSPRLMIGSTFEALDYGRQFEARAGGLSAEFDLSKNSAVSAGWRRVRSQLSDSTAAGDGAADNVRIGLVTGQRPASRLDLKYEFDRRRDAYLGAPTGARFSRVTSTLNMWSESLTYELYLEDSLQGDWRESLKRNRLGLSTLRRLRELNLDAALTYQWLRGPHGDNDAFLARASGSYQSSRQRLTVNGAWLVSEERRNARGLAYLEVESGRGNFILEDGEYVPDPNGNLLEVEEILSNQARVRRLEKSFYVRKEWRAASLAVASNIEEELKEGGRRDIWSLLPFYSDEGQPFLFFSRRNDAQLRLFPLRSFHVINLELAEELEKREVAGTPRRRRDNKYRLILRQAAGQNYFSESVERFASERDSYYAAAGDVDGLEAAVGARRVFAAGESGVEVKFRRADSDRGERSQVYAVDWQSRFRVLGRGEIRLGCEFYRQEFRNVTGAAAYLLTGNRPGERGADWSLSLNHGVKGGLRVSATLNGRHADSRTGRVTGRAEVVAGF